MNRPIKFRGKRIDNGEWIYGLLTNTNPHEINNIQVQGCSVGQFTGLLDKNKKEVYEDDIFERTTHPQIPYNVYDKNGVKIREDYTIHEGVLMRFQVIWNEKYCCFEVVIIHVNPAGVIVGNGYGKTEIAVGNKHNLQSYFNEHSIEEIIGNIHDNRSY
jgi:hypothetical protein